MCPNKTRSKEVMQAIRNHITGIQITFRALAQGKYLTYFIPGLVITLLYWFVVLRTRNFGDSLLVETEISWLEQIESYINSGIEGIFSGFEFMLTQLYIFTLLTLLSPFNVALGERLDEELTGNSYSFTISRFVKDFFRMILVVSLALFLEFSFFFLYWILSWILPFGFLDVYVYQLITAFFIGFSFYDFALERYHKSVGSSLYYAFEKPLSMILTGLLFLLLFQIPIIGVPIAVVLSVMISTVVYLYNEKLVKH